MKAITKQETIKALKSLFNSEAHKDDRKVMVSEEGGNATFMVDKGLMTRFDVINKLQEFFADKYIDGGQCRIDSITLVWTTFHIEDRAAKAKQ